MKLFSDVAHPIDEVPPVRQVRRPGIVRLRRDVLDLPLAHVVEQVLGADAELVVDGGLCIFGIFSVGTSTILGGKVGGVAIFRWACGRKIQIRPR